jgi:hypothetical protein
MQNACARMEEVREAACSSETTQVDGTAAIPGAPAACTAAGVCVDRIGPARVAFGATGWCGRERRVEHGSAGNSCAQSRAPAARNGAGGVGDRVGTARGEMGAAGGCKLNQIVEWSGTGSRARAGSMAVDRGSPAV